MGIGVKLISKFGARNVRYLCSTRPGLFSTMANSQTPRPYTVFVEGNIGSGKTTFLKHFAELSDIATLTEPVDLWRDVRGENLLGLMYSDPSRWGLTFQTYVQLSMLKLHTKAVDRPVKMMERSIHSARYCFVENLHQTGLMPRQDYVVLDEWYKFISENHAVAGDLIVYLRTTPEVVHKRMLARARVEESTVPLEYLKQLHELHENWLHRQSSFSCSAPVLVIDANKDLSSLTTDFLKCEARIRDATMSQCRRKQTPTSSPSKINMQSPIKVASPS